MNCPKCNTPIIGHPAKPCLNAVFAEVVMGWKKDTYIWEDTALFWWEKEGSYAKYRATKSKHLSLNLQHPVFQPSTNIAHAMQGEYKVPESDWIKYGGILMRIIRKDKNKPPRGYIYTYEIAHATAHQRTRALILWALEKGECNERKRFKNGRCCC